MNPPSPAPAPQSPPEPDATPLKADIVGDIPMHRAEPPAAIKESDDLDKIMQDVGHELKKDEKKPSGHHFFSKKPKTQPKLNAQPMQHQTQGGPPQQAAPNHQPAAGKPPAKPQPENKAPVMIIVITSIVTIILIAITYSIYSK